LVLTSWEELADLFDFKPDYLSAAGGMVPRPGGGKSFDYEDYWDGADLIYTGRGKRGDQTLDRPNGDAAENRRHLLVYENVSSKQLRFLGEATCTQHWEATGPAKLPRQGNGAVRVAAWNAQPVSVYRLTRPGWQLQAATEIFE